MTDSLMRLHISTGDPDEAHQWLSAAYADHKVTLSGRSTAFRFSHSVVSPDRSAARDQRECRMAAVAAALMWHSR